MVRTFNCLKKNKESDRVKADGIRLVLRQAKETDTFYLRAGFEGLKVSKEKEKYAKIHTELHEEVNVSIAKNRKAAAVRSSKSTRNNN